MLSTVSNASSTLPVTTTGSTNASAKANDLSDPTQAQDRFLKLFVAQLNNQDPMNPMDNAQMTSQMAQINTVSGIQQLNTTVKSMVSQFGAMQTLQATQMIGHDVLLQSNTLGIINGQGRASFDLAGTADSVKVEIYNNAGSLIDTISMGSQTAGQKDFSWDASAYPSASAVSYKVSASRAGKSIATTDYARDTITSIHTDSAGTLSLGLRGRDSVAYSDIRTFL